MWPHQQFNFSKNIAFDVVGDVVVGGVVVVVVVDVVDVAVDVIVKISFRACLFHTISTAFEMTWVPSTDSPFEIARN